MARRPGKTRAARAGLARGLEGPRLRRNAGKQALSRLELGKGLELDRLSRLTTTSRNGDAAQASSSPLPPLKDDTAVSPSNFRISQVTSTTAPVTTLADLQVEVETFLEEIRENFSTLTKRVNELTQRMQ